MQPDTDEGVVTVRPFWSGTISFGLVSIPVDLYPANRSKSIGLRMLAPDGTPLSRRYFCPETNTDVPPEEIVRGYELESGGFVAVTDEELEALAPEKSRDIDLRKFVDVAEIDPLYSVRSYFLTPSGDSNKAYRLLARVMEETGRAGIATFVMRGKEYLVAILAENGLLRAETLRFADEVRGLDEIDLPEKPRLDRSHVRRIEREVERRSAPSLPVEGLRDRYAERLLELVESKRKRGEDLVGAPEEGVEAEPTPVIDLMEVIKSRLQGGRAEAAPVRRGQTRAARGSGRKLEEMTRNELYELAARKNIPNRSKMTKEELLKALKRAA